MTQHCRLNPKCWAGGRQNAFLITYITRQNHDAKRQNHYHHPINMSYKLKSKYCITKNDAETIPLRIVGWVWGPDPTQILINGVADATEEHFHSISCGFSDFRSPCP